MENQRNKVVVYGGAFNPPTIAHYNLAKSVLKSINAKKLLFMPVGDRYNKEHLISSTHRTAMLELLCEDEDNMFVSYLEINSKINLNTIDTLNSLHDMDPNNDYYFLIGSDNLKNINKWHSYQSLLTKYKVLVMSRDYDNIEDIIKANNLEVYKENIIELKNIERLFVSSTKVREAIKNKENTDLMLNPKIKDYIQKNNLY